MPGVPPARYGYLGPEGTFTEAALLQVRAARDGERLAYPSVDAALAAVREGEVAAAMVPIENSVEGGVGATMDALSAGDDVVVVREALVPVSFVLAARPGTRFLSALRRSNVHGALDLGLAPGFLPGRVTLDAGRERFTDAWGAVPERRGLDASGILQAAVDGQLHGLVLLDADDWRHASYHLGGRVAAATYKRGVHL